MRTYGAADWTASLNEWELGEFGPEWRDFRHAAAMRGMIYPPTGSKWDSWEDDEPSQRAIVYRAVHDTPKLLMAAINESRSWGQVVKIILGRLQEWREDLDRRDRQIAREREHEPNPIEATQSLRAIIDRIGQS